MLCHYPLLRQRFLVTYALSLSTLVLFRTVNNVKVEMRNYQKILLKDSGHVPFDLSAIFTFLLPKRQR